MTGWDIPDKILNRLPPIAMGVFLMAGIAAVVIFLVGFSKHGIRFIKYGFSQKRTSDLAEKIDRVAIDLKELKDNNSGLSEKIDGVDVDLQELKVNHFSHLGQYLKKLNGFLVRGKLMDAVDQADMDVLADGVAGKR